MEINKEVSVISKHFDLKDQLYYLNFPDYTLRSPATRMAREFQESTVAQMARELHESSVMSIAREFQGSTAAQVARELHESSVMSIAREFQGSTAAQVARELHESSVMSIAREFQGSTADQVARELHGSSVMSIAREFQGSTAAQVACELQESPLIRMAREFQGSTAFQIARDLQDFSVMQGLLGLESSSLMGALPRLTGMPFDPALISQAVAIAQHAGNRQQLDHEEASQELAAVEDELKRLGQGRLDFFSLSESGRRTLVWLFYWIVLPFLMNIAATMALERFSERTILSESVTTPREAKKLARCSSELEKEIFAGCRVVTGGSLRLRSGPSMKAEVMANLPLGKLIVVLDSSERAWLLVEVDIEDERIEGWVSRRYTTKFR
ncbi:SH3 domain-containing protein [Halomonas colorata]|uniref:SH3 domain-containing protein n=1 Tax=Halomonas colorata TaxID=2742615 RepID=UPI001869620F|nr:SH3 domain-containing protein [Halomonas colorata]